MPHAQRRLKYLEYAHCRCRLAQPNDGIVLGQEAVDCGLQVDDRMKDAAPEAALRQLGEEALDRVEPGA